MSKRPNINLDNYETLVVHPNEIRLGDRIATISERTGRVVALSEPVKEYHRNPRGCKGNTHIDGGCYGNITEVTVVRKPAEILGERL